MVGSPKLTPYRPSGLVVVVVRIVSQLEPDLRWTFTVVPTGELLTLP